MAKLINLSLLIIAAAFACSTSVSCLTERKLDSGILDVFPEEANNESLPEVSALDEAVAPEVDEVILEAAKATTFHSRRFLRKHSLLGSSGDAPEIDHVEDKWFQQDLDHFHPTDRRTWKQRYFMNESSYKPGGPVFLMIGGEGEANKAWMSQGTWVGYAQEFQAMRFLLEHRYYGKSHPTPDMSVKNLVYLNSEQALADLATFISAMNKEHNLPSNTRWITFGGSYPGTLSAWLRLKYPHLVHGAVSTSGPFLAKANFFEYLEVVSNSLNVTNPKCDPTLRSAVAQTQLLTAHRVGWNRITEDFKLCAPFDGQKKEDVANFFESVVGNFEDVVQYHKDNREFEGAKNTNVTIETLCDIMTEDGSKEKDRSHLDLPATLAMLNERVQAAESREEVAEAFGRFNTIASLNVLSRDRTNYQKLVDVNSFMLEINGEKCLDHRYKTMIDELSSVEWSSSSAVGGRQWMYQTCTEFGWYQSSDQPDHPYSNYFPVAFLEKQCTDIFGPKFNLDLLNYGIERTNINYGARDINVSNVVFVHGSIDPWHAMGITKSLSESASAIYIYGTAHCANMYPERESDLPQLKKARKSIRNKIASWLLQ